ncbi:MAG: dihydrofolate reductase [Bacteroidetes bacterium]|nr:dihydrofolate reductase [Bacteroidota bacterium]
MSALLLFCCKSNNQKENTLNNDDFNYKIEQFGDLKIMRFQVPEFDSLTLKQKELVYYLSEAAKAGRDIIWDQNFKYNLLIRKTLEAIVESYKGDKNSDDFKKFMVYTKRVWFSNGIHHHYSSEKFSPDFTATYFADLIKNSDATKLPLSHAETADQLIKKLSPILFDPTLYSKKVSSEASQDLIKSSASNFYEGVTEKEAEDFYNKMKNPNDHEPISYGLNSKLVKENGKLYEKTYKAGGMYGKAIEQIVLWLKQAFKIAENEKQKQSINMLISYYLTGNLKDWDAYNINWVSDMESHVDFVNGFIEVYEDPLGLKATWESVVNFKDIEATKRTQIISSSAQWFEDNSPVDARFKKKEVKGVSAKVITVAQLGGECYPTTPIGINLPNADWIRKEHGSKSVTMENITYAYDKAAIGNGFMEEFANSAEEIEMAKKYGTLASNLHTDLHECLGHGSGQLLAGTNPDALKNYSSALEETRADLFALYYMMDKKMLELKLFPDLEVAKTEYMNYIRNGLMTQLVRIDLGKNIEQAHMRNRQLIALWCYEQGKKENIIEKYKKDNKTYVRINDYNKLRTLFGKLLAEVQRIKSEGDYNAGKLLVENYGVKIDPILHKEVKERYAKLNLAPYGGFMNPDFVPVMKDGKIIDIKVEYPDDYTKQMMEYGKKYSFLPLMN